MRRIVVRRPGGYSALELIEEPDPEPGPGQVRVRVAACGVNYADTIVRMGFYEAAEGLYPLTPGFEFAGTVDALGAGAKGPREGDRVFGITRFGGYASAVCAEPGRLWPCPAGWTMEEAAAFPAVHLTAYYGLFSAAKAAPGERVLVHSAAGGAGSALLQLARIHGCPAVAVVGSAEKAALCRELGAEAVIDRSREELWVRAAELAPEGYGAIFDSYGVTTLRRGLELLAPGGRLVIFGFGEIFPRGGTPSGRPSRLRMALKCLKVPRFSAMALTSGNKGIVGFNVVHLFDRRELLGLAMGRLLGWVREGALRKVPVRAFPLAQAAQAHRSLESGRTSGKVVLTP